MISQAVTVRAMDCSVALTAPFWLESTDMDFEPMRSRKRRSSGWNTMTSAMAPISRIFVNIKLRARILTTSVSQVQSSSSTIADAMRTALEDLIRSSSA